MTLTICELQNKSLEDKKEEKTLSPNIHNQPLVNGCNLVEPD